jgi:hypothetical protein
MIILVTGFGWNTSNPLCLAYLAGFGVNHGNWLTFCRFVCLGILTGGCLMMVRECTSTGYVLFWIVVVSASDPKDLFVDRGTMFTAQITGLICIGLVK